jgi:hypothetical protein
MLALIAFSPRSSATLLEKLITVALYVDTIGEMVGTSLCRSGKLSLSVKYSQKHNSESEFASISLFRKALADYPLKLIPEIYGWNNASLTSSQSGDFGWILQQHMPGVPLDQTFPTLSFEQKFSVLKEISKILNLKGSYELPTSITMYGGLGFKSKREIISGPMTIPIGGPFKTYAEIWNQNFVNQLQNAERSKFLDGWRCSDGLREGLYAFQQSNGIATLLKAFDEPRRTLVYADLGEWFYDRF